MKKKVGIIKRLTCLSLIFLLSINSIAAIVSDNDGSAFITKAEFDALKASFQSQIDSYNQSIDSKIDGAIASYLAGIKLSTEEELTPIIGTDYLIRSNDILLKAAKRDKISGKISITGGCLNLGGDGANWGMSDGVTEYTWDEDDGKGSGFCLRAWGTSNLYWDGWCEQITTISGCAFGYYNPNSGWTTSACYAPVISGGVHRIQGAYKDNQSKGLFNCCAGEHAYFAFTSPASDYVITHTADTPNNFKYICAAETNQIWGRCRKVGEPWDFNYDYLETYPLITDAPNNKLNATVRQWSYQRCTAKHQINPWGDQLSKTTFCTNNTKSEVGPVEMSSTCTNLNCGFGSNGDNYRKKQPNFGYYHPSSTTINSVYNRFNSLATLGYTNATDARATLNSGFVYVPIDAGIPIVVSQAGTLDIQYTVKKLDTSSTTYKKDGYTLIDYTGYGKIVSSDKPFSSATDLVGTHTNITEISQTWTNPSVSQKITVHNPCTIWIKWYSTDSGGSIITTEENQFELKVDNIKLTKES